MYAHLNETSFFQFLFYFAEFEIRLCDALTVLGITESWLTVSLLIVGLCIILLITIYRYIQVYKQGTGVVFVFFDVVPDFS